MWWFCKPDDYRFCLFPAPPHEALRSGHHTAVSRSGVCGKRSTPIARDPETLQLVSNALYCPLLRGLITHHPRTMSTNSPSIRRFGTRSYGMRPADRISRFHTVISTLSRPVTARHRLYVISAFSFSKPMQRVRYGDNASAVRCRVFAAQRPRRVPPPSASAPSGRVAPLAGRIAHCRAP